MERISDNRIIILNKKGKFVNYPKKIGQMHQECIELFSKSQGYSYSSIDHIVNKGNAIFYNVENGLALAYMPKKLEDEQLYKLDLMTLFMDDINYMEVKKVSTSEEFILNNNVGEKFSTEVIQSYFKKSKIKTK